MVQWKMGVFAISRCLLDTAIFHWTMIVGESVDVWIFCWKKHPNTFFERFVQEFGFGCAVSIELSLRTYKFTHKKIDRAYLNLRLS